MIMKFLALAILPTCLAAADSLANFDWGTVSATGLLGWYLWYTTKVIFPKHDDLMMSMQDRCAEELLQQRTHYEGLMSEMHDRHTEQHGELLEALEKIVDKLGEE